MEYNNDFRFDLKRGQKAEKWLGGLLEGDTMEVKRDFIAHKTKRVFVEFECSGKPSGIMKTEADLWAFVTNVSTIIVSTDGLKILVEEAITKNRVKKGGDGNRSKGAMIDLRDLVLLSTNE